MKVMDRAAVHHNSYFKKDRVRSITHLTLPCIKFLIANY